MLSDLIQPNINDKDSILLDKKVSCTTNESQFNYLNTFNKISLFISILAFFFNLLAILSLIISAF